jgi:hypothetical protein
MSPARTQTSTPPSSPPTQSPKMKAGDGTMNEDALYQEEEEARLANQEDEKRKEQQAKKKRKKKAETKAEREEKARELDVLLKQSAAFSDILTKKTQVLGRVGSSLDGKQLGEHNLEMAEQPKCMVGGTMRDYQLEGLTWMYEICSQGMSGILADEMGLGMSLPLADVFVGLDGITNWLPCRQNRPDHRLDCTPPGEGRLPWAASHRRPPEYAVQLDGRIPQMGAIHSGRHVPRHQAGSRGYFQDKDAEESQGWQGHEQVPCRLHFI